MGGLESVQRDDLLLSMDQNRKKFGGAPDNLEWTIVSGLEGFLQCITANKNMDACVQGGADVRLDVSMM